MDYSLIRNSNEFHKWHKYAPLEIQYARYADNEPSLIAAGHKIEDVYYSFSNARASFMFADSDDFGDISGKDKQSMLYTKTHFLIYAIIEYAICLDISWQVIWAYIQPSSLEYLMKQEYIKMEKECTRDNLLQQLNCAISQKNKDFTKAEKLKKIMMDFDNSNDVLKLRAIYNSIKHQGTMHFVGVGANFTSLAVAVNGRQAPMLCRKSYVIEEIEDVLLKYHCKFEQYFNKIIDTIIPVEYLNNEMTLEEFFSSITGIT